MTGHRWTNRGIGAFSVIGDWRSPNITLIIGYRVLLTLAALTNFLFRNLEIYFQENLGHIWCLARNRLEVVEIQDVGVLLRARCVSSRRVLLSIRNMS